MKKMSKKTTGGFSNPLIRLVDLLHGDYYTDNSYMHIKIPLKKFWEYIIMCEEIWKNVNKK